MKKFLFLACIVIAGYQGWGYLQAKPVKSVEPLYAQPYLIVYGRVTCGYTMRTVNELSNAGIPYQLMDVDLPVVNDILHPRMKSAGLDVRRYYLPVVDLNGSIMIRPDNQALVDRARSLGL